MRNKYVLAAASAAIAASVAVAASVAASVVPSVPVIARTVDGDKPSETGGKRGWVRVMDNFFDPRSVGVAQGAKVTFTWKGSNRHNVRFTKVPAGGSRKGSKTLRHGRWSRTFAQPGLYRYVCTLFSGMRGTITVKPPAPAASKH